MAKKIETPEEMFWRVHNRLVKLTKERGIKQEEVQGIIERVRAREREELNKAAILSVGKARKRMKRGKYVTESEARKKLNM